MTRNKSSVFDPSGKYLYHHFFKKKVQLGRQFCWLFALANVFLKERKLAVGHW